MKWPVPKVDLAAFFLPSSVFVTLLLILSGRARTPPRAGLDRAVVNDLTEVKRVELRPLISPF